jgi:hypothetical protein
VNTVSLVEFDANPPFVSDVLGLAIYEHRIAEPLYSAVEAVRRPQP